MYSLCGPVRLSNLPLSVCPSLNPAPWFLLKGLLWECKGTRHAKIIADTITYSRLILFSQGNEGSLKIWLQSLLKTTKMFYSWGVQLFMVSFCERKSIYILEQGWGPDSVDKWWRSTRIPRHLASLAGRDLWSGEKGIRATIPDFWFCFPTSRKTIY